MPIRNKLTQEKGLTLVELILAVLIFGIIAYAITSFLFTNYFRANDETRKALLHQEAKIALETIVDQIRQADVSDIALFDASGSPVAVTDIDSDTSVSAAAYSIEITYPHPVSGDINVGYKVDSTTKALVKYNPLDLTEPTTDVITSKSGYKEVKNFVIDYVDEDNSSGSYLKYHIVLEISEGHGTGNIDKKIEIKEETNFVKYKIPTP